MKKLLFISFFAALIAVGCDEPGLDDDGNLPPTEQTPDNEQDDDNNSDDPTDDPADEPDTIPNDEIWYTSSDGEIVEPYIGPGAVEFPFGDGVSIVSNTYADGIGIIKFSSPVTAIEEYAFHGCESLTSITIPDRVTRIGIFAFAGCNSLTSVTIPDSVMKIGAYAFLCRNLTAFYGKFASADNKCLIVNGTLNEFANGCGLTKYTIPDGVTTIGEGAFNSRENLTSITIPDSVTAIEVAAFWACSLTDITIPNSVTTIGDSAFRLCLSLTSVTIPDSITTIGEGVFLGCRSLTSITIPDSVTTIGYYAFRSCLSLTSITIPDSVTEIGKSAFQSCSSLANIYCKATTPPGLIYLAFSDISDDAKIYVPRESVEAYKAAKYWSEYAHLIKPYDF